MKPITKNNEINLPKVTKEFVKRTIKDDLHVHWCLLCLDSVQEVCEETDLRAQLELCYTREKLFDIDPKDNEVLLAIRSRDKSYMRKALFQNLALLRGRNSLINDFPKEVVDKILAKVNA